MACTGTTARFENVRRIDRSQGAVQWKTSAEAVFNPLQPRGYYWPPGSTSNDPSFRPQGVCTRNTGLPQKDETIFMPGITWHS